MHSHTIDRWTHDHIFLGHGHEHNERRTLIVVALTAAMMVVEIVGGAIFHSMALVADGWHMSTHALALGIAAAAYRFARLHRHDPRFSFGTGKLGELAAFASALVLAMIALYIGFESAWRLFSPIPIAFGDAIPIAVVGLGVNLASAWLLHGGAGHAHDDHDHHDAHSHADHHSGAHGHDGPAHDHAHHGQHGDTNFRAAYVHVMADALTSVLAIVALTAGRFLGWNWLDPAMGLVGTVVIAAWTFSLLRGAGAVLLDIVPSPALAESIRTAVEKDGDKVSDLHLWRLGPGHSGVILAVVSDRPQAPGVYKGRLAGIAGLSHVTVEVHRCEQALAA
jgi:cation diffusion facilitator family transporter